MKYRQHLVKWPCCSFLRLSIFSLFFPTFSWWSIINEALSWWSVANEVSAQIVTKIAKFWRCYLKVRETSPKFVTKICWIVDVGEVQRNANLIDLVKSFQTSPGGVLWVCTLLLRSFVQINNFHFSVSLHVPFSQFLFERDSYSNEYLLAKFGFDTAENEPINCYNFSSLHYSPGM